MGNLTMYDEVVTTSEEQVGYENARTTSQGPFIPFLKWPGGKRWFTQKHLHLLPRSFNVYVEPFLGSAALYFSVSPKKAIISDYNEELINTYSAIRENWPLVVSYLQQHQIMHSESYYYDIRSQNPTDIFYRAARTIYLNRTCFNGIYRVNLKGEFNVPIGTKNNIMMKTDDFSGISRLLRNAEIRHSDFETIIDSAKHNDFLFVDPPYTVKHNSNGFIKYNERIFSWDDQIRLRNSIVRAVSRGVKVLMSNANHESLHELYHGIGECFVLQRKSIISGSSTGRGSYSEYFIKTYDS